MFNNKNLLIVTQTVDEKDSNLGFFCGWLREFSKNADQVYVIANKVGDYNFPENIKVFSLGKERGSSRIVRFLRYWFYLLKYLPKVRAVFFHMCPEYVVYGGFLARLYGKKLGMWYLHKSKNLKLVLANILANTIFTAHKDGYPIKSNKVVVTGHGINIDFSMFKPGPKNINENFLKFLTVGRISESKDLLILIKATILLLKEKNKWGRAKLTIVGEPYLKEDKEYLDKLNNYLKEKKPENLRVDFEGKVLHKDMPIYYADADLLLNASKTGGVDKAVLEAMAMGLPVITSNSAFRNILPANCLFEEDNIEDLKNKILDYKSIDTNLLQDIVAKNHNLKSTINKISKILFL